MDAKQAIVEGLMVGMGVDPASIEPTAPISCWSPEQQPVVNFIAKSLALEIVRLGGQVKCYYTNGTWRAAYKKLVGQLLKDHVTLYAYRLQDLDTRPKTNDGTGFFPYTNQGLLEEVIAACKKWDVEPSIIKMLQDAV